MQRHEVPDKAGSEERPPPLWIAPPPPAGPGMWIRAAFARFGFLTACLVSLAALALLYFNSEWLLREPHRRDPQVSASRQVAVEERIDRPAAVEGGAGPVTLTVATDPSAAAVFVNGDSVGTAPLPAYALPAGTYLVTVRKTDYATVDTFVTLTDAPAFVHFTLRRPASPPVAGERPSETRSAPAVAARAPASRDDGTAAPDRPQAPAKREPEVREPAAPARQDATEERPQVSQDRSLPAAAGEPAPEPAMPSVGDLEVASEPSGAMVFLDGQVLGVTPLAFSNVPAGPQRIVLRREGYEDFTTVVTVSPEETNRIGVRLKPLTGSLKILARPWGSIYIDGELHRRETNIWYTVSLPAGVHRVRVEHPALGKWERRVEVVAGKEEEIVVDFNLPDRQ